MEIIGRYFPDLDAEKSRQVVELINLITDWNSRINLISRKDIDNLELHHVLHSMAIARFIDFKPGTRVLDLGTGGGFPGLPLAIMFPDTEFTLIDARNKKIMVVNDVASRLGLTNAKGVHIRAEDLKGKFDFVVSRAVASIDKLYKWARPLTSSKHQSAIPNGMIVLKGGEVDSELKSLPRGTYVETEPVSQWFDNPYFGDKYLVYLQF